MRYHPPPNAGPNPPHPCRWVPPATPHLLRSVVAGCAESVPRSRREETCFEYSYYSFSYRLWNIGAEMARITPSFSPIHTATSKPYLPGHSLPIPPPPPPLDGRVRHGCDRHRRRRRRGLRRGEVDGDVRRHDGGRRARDVEDGGDDVRLDVWVLLGALVFYWEALGVPFAAGC